MKKNRQKSKILNGLARRGQAKKEKFFWADEIANQIIKKNPKKKEYICASGITPSGIVHIGNFREVITTDLVVKSLKDKGKEARFIYSWDDYDRFRKVPVNIPKNYEKYIGMPVSEVPSPSKKNKSYARYLEEPFENALKKVGIKPTFVQQSKMNKQRKYAKLIKLAIEKKEDIIEILNRYRREPLEDGWYPVTVYCEKCEKDFTKIISIKEYIIEYECVCGFKSEVDFSKKGIIKLVWRVDWPMRWKYEDVDFEPGGIDHSVQGGSFTTAQEIVKKVFDGEIPIYVFYDWIKLKGGKEFASSAGNALSPDEVLEVYEPEVLRYLFVGTKPKTGFQISFDNDVIKIYDEFDELERRYYENETNLQEKRIYELSQIKINKKKPERVSFRHLVTLVQIGKTKNLRGVQKSRAEKVENWLKKYAGEDMKFKVQEKVNIKLSEKQKESLIALKESLAVKNFNEDKLFNEFYDICNAVGIEVKEFFQGAYNVIINKNKGPRLATLILIVGKEKIIKLLNQIK